MRALLRTAITLAIGVGLVVGAVRLPDVRWHLAGSSAAGERPTAAPAPRAVDQSALVCPGPETVGVKGVDAKTAVTPTTVRVASPPADLVSAALAGVRPATGSASGAPAPSVQAAAIGGSGLLGLAPLLAPGAGSAQTSVARSVLLSGSGPLATGLAAAQSTLVTSGDQRGLSTSACQAPVAQTWLVGGGGEPGRRGRVVLTNPSPNGVTVDLLVYGAKGLVAAPTARGIVVGAHKRAVVLLDAIAPGERSPVIHVVASGGLISAALNDSWLDGTTPAGSDDVVGTAPGGRLVIPGVVALGTPGSTTLRIAATDKEAVVQVRMIGATGPTAAPVNNGVVRVPAHRVKTVDLSAVPAGTYGVELRSDQPVVAGVQMRSAGDLAWTTAEPGITALSGLPLGPVRAPWSASVALTAAHDDAKVDLVSVAADGTATVQSLAVLAGTTVSSQLKSTAVSLWLRVTSGSVTAALLSAYTDATGSLRSVAPLASTPLLTTPVAVHPLAG